MSIYRHYTHELRMADKALKEDMPAEKHNLVLLNALENLACEYSRLLETLEGQGVEFSHGLNGQISAIVKKD